MDTPLNFDRADFAGQPVEMACRNCQAPMTTEYYQINGQPICGACRERFATALAQRGNFGRAALCGFGAAVAGCAIYYAVLATGFAFGLIAVLVGWMVGKAVRLGSGGVGGRRYQVLALILTYLAITSSYLPDVMAQAPMPHSLAGALIRVVMMAVIALIFPVLQVASGGFSSILSLVILGIGLWEAWKFTRGVQASITGPYPVGAQPTTIAS